MTLTLLLDLDDTLLYNPVDQFLPAYAQLLAKHLAPYADPSALIQALNAGTRRMVDNQQPDCSLKEVFESVFYPALKLQPQDLEPAIEQFYVQVFPTLKKFSHPIPAAIQLVEMAFERGYRVAIATTPLFPMTATLQRLEWASLSTDKYPFDVVSSYETFHFAKPNPAFFAEVLARMGWPEGPLVIAGDDIQKDIYAGNLLGTATYWVHPDGSVLGDASTHTTSVISTSGDIAGLLPWLDGTPPDDLQPHYNGPPALQAILRSTPAALKSLCHDLQPGSWSTRPAPEEWSPTEILCHLRDVDAEVNLPRINKMLAGSNPFLPGVDSDRWAAERNYQQQDGQHALRHFVASRMRMLRILENMSFQDWERSARHSIFGPTQLKELVSIVASHDQVHVRQMVNTLADRVE